MVQEILIDSDDSGYSETDLSIRGPRRHTSFRRRSVSRRRPEQFLSPERQGTRVVRSASTGGRRPREREQPTVMIINDQQQRNAHDQQQRSVNKPRRVQQRVVEQDSEDEYVHSPRRHRAVSGVTRTPSPYHRDQELVLGQRFLEKSDHRHELELWKHQQEIERLERELDRHRERAEPRDWRESRALREEEEWYEEEINARLRRLERLDRKNRTDEDRRQAEYRLKIERFEEAEREAAEKEEVKAKLRDEKLKELQRQKEADEERDRIKKEIKEEKLKQLQREREEEEEREKMKKEIRDEEARKALEAEEEKKKALLAKAAAVEEWKLEQERKKQEEREEAEKRDKEFRERLRIEFGYTEEEIDAFLKKKRKDEKKDEKDDRKDDDAKMTWIKVHRKHLLPETLIAYSIPWDWDERDSNYIIIKRWITEDFQEELFSHSRRLREGKVLTQTSSSLTELKVNDRNKDKMYLIRKKSPSRRLRIF
ncbi:hypothetical protein NUU61_007924 [Penicillium alfredii]|uniref:Uncharacterized protein n=1 Tax=Penicillium alfredii TaxID=1506179 RepID=A0A9W9ERE3_9EURO|nr:uncharacterized protein NUU61_007924 [Penicillium alfredii]KAJ5086617.1 hypothetical protein NUU61_007924 [Penicillium alfredii]